jgi:SAM-dependent methyltransferase
VEEQYYPLVHAVEDRHWWFRGRRSVVSALLASVGLQPPVRVLDAGCGTGRNLEEYRRLGPVRGIEPSPSAVEFCHRRGLSEVVRATIEELPFPDSSFDLVFATDVLEHVDDDVVALRELRRVCAHGAALVATVPAHRRLWSQSDVALQHRRRYSREHLEASARSGGWTPERATYFNTILLPAIAAARAVRRGRGSSSPELELTPGWVNGPLSLPLRLEAALIRRGRSLPTGVSVGLVARA